MANNPPISRRQLQKAGMLDEDQFYAELAAESGMDKEAVQRVYLAQVRLINRKIFQLFICRLPHLGDFALPMMAAREALIGKKRQLMPPMRRLKFYPLEKWVHHVNGKLGYLKDNTQ